MWLKRDPSIGVSLPVSINVMGEVKSILCLFRTPTMVGASRSRVSDSKSVAQSCSRQLHARADSLQNSDLAGPSP